MIMRAPIAAALLLLAAAAAQANVEITVESRKTTFPVKGVQKLSGNKASTTQTRLTLGTRWVQWDEGNSQGVYDFEKRVVIRVDPEEHRLVEESLYASLSGRAMELDNRLMLGSALQAAHIDDNPMAPTLAEHQLSLRRDPQRRSDIQRKSVKGEQRYLWRKKELFAYSTELVPLPAAARDLYIRFIRYVVGVHPEILDDLEKLDGIPRWIRRSDPAYGDAQRLEVLDTKETPDAPYVLPALEKATLKDPDTAAAAASVRASTPESRAAVAASILAAANAAADGGRPLEAMLGYLEGHLMTGEELGPDFKKRAEMIAADANVKALLGAIRAQNAEQSVATLTRLAQLAGGKAYVAGIFRANMERRLDRETATHLFVSALMKNPFITGVWKDLGDILDNGYDAVDTWRCYEIAKLIAPDHSLLAQVARREASLAKEHPEYF